VPRHPGDHGAPRGVRGGIGGGAHSPSRRRGGRGRGHAAQLAVWGGAQVLATVRDRRDEARVRTARVYVLGEGDVGDAILRDTPGGVDRIIEVALGPNGALDAAVLAQGGVIAAYASPEAEPKLPFWPLLFQNAVIRLLGSDDFPPAAKQQAAEDIVTCLEAGPWGWRSEHAFRWNRLRRRTWRWSARRSRGESCC
jgi:NADPH:quinone reductase-like Zn-dependent oxidoreductase